MFIMVVRLWGKQPLWFLGEYMVELGERLRLEITERPALWVACFQVEAGLDVVQLTGPHARELEAVVDMEAAEVEVQILQMLLISRMEAQVALGMFW